MRDAGNLYELLKSGEDYLLACGIEDARIDAWLLLEFVTGTSRAMFLADRYRPVKEEECVQYEALIKRRGTHIPLQHLTGGQEFMGLPFLVNEHVLIPRQDTETLVEEALKRLRPGMTVLDLCTGSGCIAVSLAKLGCVFDKAEQSCHTEVKTASGGRVDAADISQEALNVACENGARNGVRINWIHSDLFEEIPECYDMIVSNPPYIRTSVIEELSEEVRIHEPFGALDGKEDGLYFYRRIVEESRAHLQADGWLLFEIGYDQGLEVQELMLCAGFSEVQIIQDLAGKDRVALGHL